MLTQLTHLRRLPSRFRTQVNQAIRHVNHANIRLLKFSKLQAFPHKDRWRIQPCITPIESGQEMDWPNRGKYEPQV